MTGKNIVKMLEYYMNKKKDRFVFIPYTLKYTYSEDKDIEITEILFKNKKMKLDKKYSVVVDERMAKEFERFYDAENLKEIGEDPAEEYIKYLKKLKKYNPRESGRVVKS